jgi:RNA polymerase sigma-70 factor (ECF subfamily)
MMELRMHADPSEVQPRRNDPGAAAELYDEHSHALYAYALSLTGDAAASEDLVHDAFVRLIEYPHIPESDEAFLFTVVRNRAIDLRRRGAVRRDHPAPLPLRADGPDAAVADAATLALGRLPEEQREAVVLKIYSGLTFADIGRLTGTSLATAASRYRLGLEKMAGWLSQEMST